MGMRPIIPILFATTLVLTACGGGGGNPLSPVMPPTYKTVSGYTESDISITPGQFTSDGSKYVVLTAFANQFGSTKGLPVKIFKVASTGLEDKTVDILGEEVSWTVQYALVADFNSDGVDDLALMGWSDIAPTSYKSAFFISQIGTHHRKTEFITATYNHGVTAADIDGDGDIDIINAEGRMWLNDGAGNFTFRERDDWQNGFPWPMTGNGVCVADFNNVGHPQVLVTDVGYDAQGTPTQDTVIFDLNTNLQPIAHYQLPTPLFENGGAGELSHDVSCIVHDVNSDGLPDVFVVSAYNGGVRKSKLQLYINQGGYNFIDATATNISGYDENLHSSYHPLLIDVNGDGRKDLWLKHFDWNANQISNALMLNISGVYTQSNRIMTNIMSIDFGIQFGGTHNGPSLPIKINGNWYLIVTYKNDPTVYIDIKPINWTF